MMVVITQRQTQRQTEPTVGFRLETAKGLMTLSF